ALPRPWQKHAFDDLGAGRNSHLWQGAVRAHWQPAQFHQHRSTSSGGGQRVGAHAYTTFTLLVVQQQHGCREEVDCRPDPCRHLGRRSGERISQWSGWRRHRGCIAIKPALLFSGPAMLPETKRRKDAGKEQCQYGPDQPTKHAHVSVGKYERQLPLFSILRAAAMWPKIIIILFLLLIIYNLGAGLYYMIVDKGQSKRTVNALSWRVGLSAALVVLVLLGIWSGVLAPHGIGR